MDKNKLQQISLLLLCGLCLLPVRAAHAFEYTVEEAAAAYGYGYDYDVSHWTQIDLISPITLPVQEIAQPLQEYGIHSVIDLGFAASHWRKSNHKAYHASALLMLRTTPAPTAIGRYFFEIGFGPHLLTNPQQTDRLSTEIEFSSNLGAGLYFSEHWGVVARARHISNGGFKTPNPGVNMLLLQLHYRFGN